MSRRNVALVRLCAVVSIACGARSLAAGQEANARPPSVTERVRQFRIRHDVAIVEEFAELLSIPNVQSDGANIRRNADLLKERLERRGLRTRLLEIDGSPPAVYGEFST